MKSVILFTLCGVGLLTCSEKVRLKDSARDVEFVSQSWIGSHKERCRQVGDFSVEAIPAELSGEPRMTVLDIKAKNLARERGGTHLLRWPAHEFRCDKNGTPNEESERTCATQEITAYECVVGRGS